MIGKNLHNLILNRSSAFLHDLKEHVDRKLVLEHFRPFTLEDLLSHEVIRLDTELIFSYILNKNILITGCGGSIGSGLCRQQNILRPS